MDNKNTPTDDLDSFLVSGLNELPEHEIDPEKAEEILQKMNALSEEILFMMNDLSIEESQVYGENEKLNLETKEMVVRLPPTAWKAFATIEKIFTICDELEEEGLPLMEISPSVQNFFSEKFQTESIQEVFLSQALFKAIFEFAINVARAEIQRRFYEASQSNDPEAMNKFDEFFKRVTGGDNTEN